MDITQTKNFSYDNFDRLTGVTGSSAENYEFNSVGNRTSSSQSATYAYQPNNRLTNTATASYVYNVNGNMTSKTDSSGITNYVWDYENRLKQATKPNGTVVNFKYDALGRRSERNINGTVWTKFTYDGQDVMLDQNSDGTTVRYLNGLGIDNKLRIQNGTAISYLLSDHLGSTTAQTDATGNITNTASYDGFGNATGNLNTRYQFTGREFDADLGLQYSRARFYDAKLGRFISEDPIGFGGGGVNQFAYTSNNAVNATDPSGLYEIDVHYYLTYYLVKKSGCFSRSQTAAIANGNQLTDEDSNYSPGFGKVFQNSTYHALNDNAEEGVGSRDLRLLSAYPTANFLEFGRYLHYFQDTFSHSGFHSPTYGHGASGHTVDKTASDVEKAMRMSRQTYEEISRFAAEECNCKAKNWNKSIEDTAKAFAGVPIDHDPYYFDIAGEGLPGMPALAEYASPGALNKKITILGVPYR